MLKLILSLLVSLFLLNSAPSYALSKLGHKAICQLSFQQLPAPSQAKILQLLTHIPKKEQQRINQYNYQKRTKPITFADSCTWADAVKKDNSYDKYKTWHYRNINRNQSPITQLACDSPCITEAIAYHQQQLTSTTGWQQTQALMFLGHWLGDIHQPLHISFADDRGGNSIKIKLAQQKCNNLHWLWDECLVNYRLKKGKNKQQQLVSNLHQIWQTSPITSWQKDDILVWANESFAITQMPAFKYCTLDNNKVCQARQTNPLELDERYGQQFSPILERQLVKAAARLTALLEQHL